MKKHVKAAMLFFICFLSLSLSSFSQTITADTTLANQYFDLSKKNDNSLKFDSAIFYIEKAQVLNVKYFGEKSLKNADCLYFLGWLYGRDNKYDLALENDLKALQIRKEILGEKHPDVALSCNNIGLIYKDKGEYDEALEYHFKALQIRQEILGEKHPDVAKSYNNIGVVYNDIAEYDKALEYYLKALQIRNEIFGEKHSEVAKSYDNIGSIHNKKGEYDQALEYYNNALHIRQKILGEKHPDVASSYNNIGVVYDEKGEYDKALMYHFKSLQIRQEILGEKHRDVAESYDNIGSIHNKKGEYDQALEYYNNALHIRQKILGEKHPDVASSYNNIGIVYDEKGDYDQALGYYLKSLQIKKEALSEKHPDVAKSYYNIGIVFNEKGEYDQALEYFLKALQIIKETLGEKHPDVASSYHNIAIAYYYKAEYDQALEYFLKALQIRKETLGEKHLYVAMSINNIGGVYYKKGEYDKALEYFLMALPILREILGEKHPNIASNYTNIGSIYSIKGENDKALEYYIKALQIKIEILGEKHPDIALCYNNIGSIYYDKDLNEKALDYYLKALQIRKEVLGEKHPDIAISYNSIGRVYTNISEYEKALEYLQKAIKIIKETLGEEHPNLASAYESIGVVNYQKGDYDKALEYCFKALQIKRKILGEIHPRVAKSYNNIGIVYGNKGEYNKALDYYQKGIASCIYDFNDTVDVYRTPIIKGYLDWNYLIQSLQLKARIIADKNKILKGLSYNEKKKIAQRHYQACDTLIDITRKEITTQSDKLSLGERAGEVYREAVDLLIPILSANDAKFLKNISDEDRNLAFYFSEKNKSSVLLEALAGQEAQKYAGIPDSLLQKERNLKIDIGFYSKKLAEPDQLDSSQIALYRDRLFLRNRSYDSLILVFENQFPEYYKLKYENKPATIKDIQKLLDKRTAMISYVVGDSTIAILKLTKSNLDVTRVPKIRNLNDSIVFYRYGLTLEMPEITQRLGYKLYQQLFPDTAPIDGRIENLYIVPDGSLATLPFESLLTENYTGNINAYNEYPYLIKKYNISYSYSANLFYQTFSKKASSTGEVTTLNDWLAFAPVFDSQEEQNMTMPGIELQRQLNGLKTDSLLTHRSMFDRNAVRPLPATETETETIFKLYNDNNLKSKVLLHNDANEKFIKSGDLERYKVLHFATHGFVNSERPELSGLLLAQDTTGGEDGILYSGEIYNLKLNADLVVLSACETGLGKIQEGEGIIGLTRALLYAGAKNIIVSLWQVPDKSTSDLMVDFYKNLLSGKGRLSYSEALRKAKMKMISEGNNTYPFFWSPFILIGK